MAFLSLLGAPWVFLLRLRTQSLDKAMASLIQNPLASSLPVNLLGLWVYGVSMLWKLHLIPLPKDWPVHGKLGTALFLMAVGLPYSFLMALGLAVMAMVFDRSLKPKQAGAAGAMRDAWMSSSWVFAYAAIPFLGWAALAGGWCWRYKGLRLSGLSREDSFWGMALSLMLEGLLVGLLFWVRRAMAFGVDG